ncbi:DUF72 domain-containing protein [Prauserella rugosa]|uniref:Uncharacterized protein YecE (DUF72 family) n=1 Tax=Prauserella rugosa TaxID=43354 RepID=A0A660CC06_9PSEU|nr:DUF72 domain-containing protein [Prauserella rugosa]KID31746.1 hypothetical protein HQ32_00626 [Prauserella sp. Am3]TWH21022.1 uncharacterized protein YecE (DUF72 family) [Prauserella rugosa]
MGAGRTKGDIRIGTSGWVYPPWRGTFYPKGLPQRRELEYLSRRLNTVEINGSFYSLQRPERYRSWFEQVPDDFVFSVKGGRFITHMKRLRDVTEGLANFFASGVLALEHKLGPVLWQLPARTAFDAELLSGFFGELPRSTGAAAELARDHNTVRFAPHTSVERDRRVRHALEVRHPSFATAEAVDLLREHDIGLVVTDSAGEWPRLEDVTADFVYVRLHGAEELYASGYPDSELAEWADKVLAWRSGRSPRSDHTVAPAARRRSRDVFVYFDNDRKAKAPGDAITLARNAGAAITPPDAGV